MQSAFDEKKKNGLKRLVEFQHSIDILTKIADQIFPFLAQCFKLDRWSLDFFKNEYLWSCRSYDRTYSHLSQQEIIDFDEYLYNARNNFFQKKKCFQKKFTTPCLMTSVDEIENLMINDIYGILCFLKEIEKNEVLSS